MSTPTASLMALPVELIEWICALGPVSSLLALRSTCHGLQALTRAFVDRARFAHAAALMERPRSVRVMGHFSATKFDEYVEDVIRVARRLGSSRNLQNRSEAESSQDRGLALRFGGLRFDQDGGCRSPDDAYGRTDRYFRLLACLYVLVELKLHTAEHLRLGRFNTRLPSSQLGLLSNISSFRELRSLHLHLTSPVDVRQDAAAWSCRQYMDMRVLGEIVLRADNMEDLALIFDDTHSFTPDRYVFNYIMARSGDDRLRRLRKLQLYNQMVNRHAFVEFASKRRSVLHEMFLCYVQDGLEDVWLQTQRQLQSFEIRSTVLLHSWTGIDWLEQYAKAAGLNKKGERGTKFGPWPMYASFLDPDSYLHDPVYAPVRNFGQLGDVPSSIWGLFRALSLFLNVIRRDQTRQITGD